MFKQSFRTITTTARSLNRFDNANLSPLAAPYGRRPMGSQDRPQNLASFLKQEVRKAEDSSKQTAASSSMSHRPRGLVPDLFSAPGALPASVPFQQDLPFYTAGRAPSGSRAEEIAEVAQEYELELTAKKKNPSTLTLLPAEDEKVLEQFVNTIMRAW